MTSPDDRATAQDTEQAAVLFDFLSDYYEDREAGQVASLQSYLQRYPGFEEAVAREYLHLQQAEQEAEAGSSGEEQVGPYRLLKVLGEGGQGAVYLAEDTRIARRVALKLLRHGFIGEDARARFRREAEVIARLDHPGICRIYEAEIDGEVPFLAMRYVEGESLREAVERAREASAAGRSSLGAGLPLNPKRRSDLGRLLIFFERIARALHSAHVAGVVHRDVKPGNISLSKELDPVLLDFGLARDEEDLDQALTRSGDIYGTPLYMSPEQVRGRRDLDGRTDVFSLGVCLYECLTLERPFHGDSRFELELSILEKPLPDPRGLNPSLPDELVAVLETALERDRARRYASALEFAEDLRRLREYEPVHARPAGAWLRLRRWVQRQPVLATALLAVLVLLVGGLILQNQGLRRTRAALDRAEGSLLAVHSARQLAVDPAGALGLALESVRRYPSEPTRSALFGPLRACQLERAHAARGAFRLWDVDLRADGTQMAVVNADALRIWAFPDGREPEVFPLPDQSLCRVSFDPLDRGLWVGTKTGQVGFLPASGARELRWYSVQGGAVVSFDFSADGERLVVLSDQGPARVLSCPEGEPLVSLDHPEKRYGAAYFVLEDQALLLGYRAAAGFKLDPARPEGLALFDAHSGVPIAILQVHRGDLLDFAVSPDGESAVSVGGDGQVLLHDLRTRTSAELGRVPGQARSVAFDSSGKRVLVGTDREANGPWLFSLDGGEPRSLPGPRRSAARVAFSPDGTRALSISGERSDPTVLVYDLAGGADDEVRELRTIFPPLEARWSPDSSRLVSYGLSAYLHQWSAGNLPHFFSMSAGTNPVWLSFAAEGEELITASSRGLRVFACSPDASSPGELLWEAEIGAVRAVRQDPSGRRLLVALENARLAWVDLVGRSVEQVSEPLPALVRDLALGESGSWGAAVLEDGRALRLTLGEEPLDLDVLGATSCALVPGEGGVQILIAGRGPELVRRIGLGELPGAPLESVDVRSANLDGEESDEPIDLVRVARLPGVDGALDQLCVAASDKSLRFLELPSYRPTPMIHRLFQADHLSVRPGEDELLVWGLGGSLSVRWIELSSKKQSYPQGPRHGGRLTACALDPGSGWVVTGAEDGGVFLWNERHELSARMLEHTGPIRALAFGPAGARIASVDASGRVFVWPSEPYSAALERQPRRLEEWDFPAWMKDSGSISRR